MVRCTLKITHPSIHQSECTRKSVNCLHYAHSQPIWNSQCQLPEFSGNLLREGTRLGRNYQCYEIPSDDPHSVGNQSELPIASFIQLHNSHAILRMVHVQVQNTNYCTRTPQFSHYSLDGPCLVPKYKLLHSWQQ